MSTEININQGPFQIRYLIVITLQKYSELTALHALFLQDVPEVICPFTPDSERKK